MYLRIKLEGILRKKYIVLILGLLLIITPFKGVKAAPVPENTNQAWWSDCIARSISGASGESAETNPGFEIILKYVRSNRIYHQKYT